MFKVGTFRNYIASHPIQLGFTHDGSSQRTLPADEVFEFDGQTLILPDGTRLDKATGIRGMIENGYIEEVEPVRESPERKKKSVKTKKAIKTPKPEPVDEGLEALLGDMKAVEPSPEVEEEDDYAAFQAWKAAQKSKKSQPVVEDDEDEDELDMDDVGEDDVEDEEEIIMEPVRRGTPRRASRDEDDDMGNDESIPLRGGIKLDRRQDEVFSGRSFGGSNPNTMEHSARAQVGSLVNPLSSGVQVGRPGQTKSDTFGRSGGREKIGFEKGATIRDVSIITSGTKTSSDVSQDYRDPKHIMQPKGLPVQYVGEGAKQKKREEEQRRRELDDEERTIAEHEKKIKAIQTRHPKFFWDLRQDAKSRFDQAWAYWQKGQTSSNSKKIFNLIMEVELPGMITRLQQEIDSKITGYNR